MSPECTAASTQFRARISLPVCPGYLRLDQAVHYSSRDYHCSLLMNCGGDPLHECAQTPPKETLIAKASNVFQEIRELEILHYDAETRNMPYKQELATS